MEPLIKVPRSSHKGKPPWTSTELQRSLLDMGISSTLWRLSKLSWVSYGMRWWPGLCVTWRVPAEKAPFQAAHSSCQHHSGKETCWYPPTMGSCLAPCSPVPANAAGAHGSKGADQCHHTSPHSLLFLHSSSSSSLLLLPNTLGCPFVCYNHPMHTLSSLLGPRSRVWEIP